MGAIRATYRCPDQAPFSAGSPGRLRCRSLFIANRPNFGKRSLSAALATSQFSGQERAFCPPLWHPPTDPLPPLQPRSTPVSPLLSQRAAFRVPSHSPTHGRRPIKMHNKAFYQSGESFLHRTVSKPPRPRLCVALQPIPLRGRGASDTVLSISVAKAGSHARLQQWVVIP